MVYDIQQTNNGVGHTVNKQWCGTYSKQTVVGDIQKTNNSVAD